MTRPEFKDKFLTDAYFFINFDNHIKIQNILNEFGIKVHMGDGIISWHDGFRCIKTFSPDEWHDFEYYQKVEFVPSYDESKVRDYESMLAEYNLLPPFGRPKTNRVAVQSRIDREIFEQMPAKPSRHIEMIINAYYRSAAVREMVGAYYGRSETVRSMVGAYCGGEKP